MTLLDQTVQDLPVRGERGTAATRYRRPRFDAVDGAVLVLLLAGILLPEPTCLLASVVLAGAAAVRRWFPWDLALPVGTLGILVLVVAVTLAAGFGGADLLSRPSLVVACWAGTVLALLLSRRRGPGLVPALPIGWKAFTAAQLPAAACATVAVLQSLDVRRVAGWMFYGTDFAEHAVLLGSVQAAGALDYSDALYPRGAHALLALVSVPGLPPETTAELLTYDLRLLASASWLALALLLWTSASLVLRGATRCGSSAAWSAAAAGGLGVVALHDADLMLVFVAMAAAPGLLAAVAVCVVPLAALTTTTPRGAGRAMTAVCAVAALALSQLWPPLLLAPVFAWLAVHLSRDRWSTLWSPRRLAGRGVVGPALAAVLGVIGVATVLVPVLAILRGQGLSIAAIGGRLPAPALGVFALGALGLVVWRRRDARLDGLLGAAAGLVAGTGVLLLFAGGGLDLSQYYPRKTLWFLAVLLLPPAAVLIGTTVRMLWTVLAAVIERSGDRAPLVKVVCGSIVAALLVSFVLPQMVVRGTLAQRALHVADPEDARKLDVAVDHGVRYAPAVTVPLEVGLTSVPRPHDSYVVSKLLAFRTGQSQTFGDARTACDVVRLVADGRQAVVVTDLDEVVVERELRLQGCSVLRVVRIPGGDAQARQLVEQRLQAARAD